MASVVRVSTRLEAPADLVWGTLRKTELLLYVMRPLLSVRGELPESWPGVGETVRIERLVLFGLVPLWPHEIRVLRFDEDAREALTEEAGGPVKVWRHRIKVEPLTQKSCRYTDEIEVEAGRLTPLVRVFAGVFYRHRQARWRALARVIG